MKHSELENRRDSLKEKYDNLIDHLVKHSDGMTEDEIEAMRDKLSDYDEEIQYLNGRITEMENAELENGYRNSL